MFTLLTIQVESSLSSLSFSHKTSPTDLSGISIGGFLDLKMISSDIVSENFSSVKKIHQVIKFFMN
jgi:hypothetical protein